ncbi:MAG: NusG domain II-containing protein [Bacilli bacterium]|nr:NusG domain II-containing protein [Bacilli bacterium]
MKRLDFLVIFLIVLICIGLYVAYFKYQVTEVNKIDVYYQNIYLESFSIETEETIYITSNIERSVVIISYSETQNEYEIEGITKEIINTFSISNYQVRMIESNCPNHYCEAIVINNQSKRPIVCTNGIVIKLSNDDVDIII